MADGILGTLAGMVAGTVAGMAHTTIMVGEATTIVRRTILSEELQVPVVITLVLPAEVATMVATK